MPEQKNTIDSLFENLGNVFSEYKEPAKVEPITLWIPEEYKAKYDFLQDKTKRRFGKFLKEVLIKSIDKVEIEAS